MGDPVRKAQFDFIASPGVSWCSVTRVPSTVPLKRLPPAAELHQNSHLARLLPDGGYRFVILFGDVNPMLTFTYSGAVTR